MNLLSRCSLAHVVLVACVLLAGAAVLHAAARGTRWGVATFPSGTSFTLEIADTATARARGYMFREHVGDREGMLFVFERTEHHGFWMKNCKVALDMIWLDERFFVVEIAHDRQPCAPDEPCRTIVPMAASRYVLEVAAGGARREGLRRGDRIEVDVEPPLP